MVKVFPNIILNKVDYSDISVPKHWDLSGRHKNDVKDSVSKHYEKFRVFYEDSSLFSILREIQELCQNIIVLSNITPAFSTIKYKGKEVKPVFDERTSKFLFEYYILKVLTNYIDLAESDVTQVRKATVNVSTDDADLVTREYLDGLSTGLDLESRTRDLHNFSLLKGNKKELKQNYPTKPSPKSLLEHHYKIEQVKKAIKENKEDYQNQINVRILLNRIINQNTKKSLRHIHSNIEKIDLAIQKLSKDKFSDDLYKYSINAFDFLSGFITGNIFIHRDALYNFLRNLKFFDKLRTYSRL
jgi:hypothetical protein